ncbi:MAG: VWA domain-containing protein [Bdellovibrionales bacterium]|nr:VWA domain-containing protein [Bdellovibrionales bacterium]
MKAFSWRAAAIAASVFVTVLAFQNCDQTRLTLISQPMASAKSNGEICAITPSLFESYTKVMFVVDKSGSNVTTDTNNYRVNTITDFFRLHQNNAYIQWGLVVFNGTGALPYVEQGGVAAFTSDIATMTNAINRIGMEADSGGTPYGAAVNLVQTAIQVDKQTSGDTANYIVVFLSDGVPTDGYGVNATMEAGIRGLKALGRVSFSTVYYGPTSPAASTRLEDMARIGDGKFLDTNFSGQIPIDELLGSSNSESWVIKNFVVTNVNAAPCDDGTIDADSDGDGLCDKDEIRYNREFANHPDRLSRMRGRQFDPYNRNSFDNYLSDAIFAQHILYGERVPTCVPGDEVDHDRDLANACEERYFSAANPSGPTANWTAAMGLDGDPYNFDSDGDGFLDWFEFVMTRNKSAALDRNNLQLEYGNPGAMLRLDTIFRRHLNWINPSSTVPYDGVFRFSHVNKDGQNCYSYSQTVLPLYYTEAVAAHQVSGNHNLVHGKDENVIMIYFIQTPKNDPNGPGELRYMFQRVSAQQNEIKLNLNADSYQAYRVGSEARVNK